MILSRVKQAVAAVAALVVIGALLTVLAGAASTIVAASTGANPSDAFSRTHVIPESLRGIVTWGPDATDLPRAIEPRTREAIEGTWVRGWGDLELVSTGRKQDVDLSIWFDKRALASAASALDTGADRGAVAPVSASAHSLTVDFYSADGQIVALRSQSTVTRTIDGVPFEFDETFRALLVLSDGNWRTEQLIRTGVRTGTDS